MVVISNRCMHINDIIEDVLHTWYLITHVADKRIKDTDLLLLSLPVR